MKRFLILCALLALSHAEIAVADASGTLTSDGQACETSLNWGQGFVLLSGTFGSGTATLQIKRMDNTTWQDVKDYTAVPSPNPENLDFGRVPVQARIDLSGSTSPSLYCEIRAGSN